jgi:hypothetical protein
VTIKLETTEMIFVFVFAKITPTTANAIKKAFDENKGMLYTTYRTLQIYI